MLPRGFDIQTMIVIMWIVIIVCMITALMLIKSLDKPVLRVVITIVIAGIIISSYQYTRILGECSRSGTQCTFFNAKVPQDGGFIN